MLCNGSCPGKALHYRAATYAHLHSAFHHPQSFLEKANKIRNAVAESAIAQHLELHSSRMAALAAQPLLPPPPHLDEMLRGSPVAAAALESPGAAAGTSAAGTSAAGAAAAGASPVAGSGQAFCASRDVSPAAALPPAPLGGAAAALLAGLPAAAAIDPLLHAGWWRSLMGPAAACLPPEAGAAALRQPSPPLAVQRPASVSPQRTAAAGAAGDGAAPGSMTASRSGVVLGQPPSLTAPGFGGPAPMIASPPAPLPVQQGASDVAAALMSALWRTSPQLAQHFASTYYGQSVAPAPGTPVPQGGADAAAASAASSAADGGFTAPGFDDLGAASARVAGVLRASLQHGTGTPAESFAQATQRIASQVRLLICVLFRPVTTHFCFAHSTLCCRKR